MQQLIEHGEVRRGLLGVQIQDLTPDIAKAMGIEATGGAVVAKVDGGSPAEKASVKAGDVIIAVDGESIRNASELRNKIGLARVGEDVRLTVLRKGEKLSLTAVLSPRRHARLEAAEVDRRLAGAVFGAIEEGSPLFGRVKGVEVLDIQTGSPAWQAGLRQADVITSVNQQLVTTPDELAEAAQANKGVLLLNVRRGDVALFMAIR